MRHILKSVGIAAAMVIATAGSAAFAEPVTPELIAAAEKEGTVTYYSATNIKVAQGLVNLFQKKYPKIKVVLERNGGERIFQRVSQEYASGIHNIDTITSSEMGHAVYWKNKGWLAKYIPEAVEKYWPKDAIDPDGMYTAYKVVVVVFAVNKNLVKEEEMPKSWADLLDPKWKGKLAKAHPNYSGTAFTSTYLAARAFGWDYFAQLAKQNVLQLQSAGDPPRKVALGERLVGIDTSEQSALTLMEKGAPLKLIYPTDGTPLSRVPAAVMKDAPHPNAARLLYQWLVSLEGQQAAMDLGNNRGLHPGVKTKGQPKLSEIKKVLYDPDPDGYAKASANVKEDYEKYFTANNNKKK